MPGEAGDRADFFLSRRGSVAAVAQEVSDVLTDKGYKVLVQDYDIPLGASFIETMHEAIKNARDLIILFTADYEKSGYTRQELTSFEAERLRDERDRHIVVLRCDDAPLRGLLADRVYQDLVGVAEPEERKRRIIAAAERHSSAERPQRRRGRTFVGVPPRIAGFTGRADELDSLDAVLAQDRPVAVTQVGRAAVQGLGGVGKSTLAIEYAYRFRGLYDGVWWCPAETRAGLMTSLAALASELEVASPEEADIEKAARAALRRIAEQGDVWLLVYDNVPTPSDIANLLPIAGARTLITSRFSDWSGWADEVTLDVLPIAEAIAFLMDRAARSDEAGAQTLAEALGRLPLALDHAAATCKQTQMSFAAYAAKALSLIAAAPRGALYPRSVAATFDLAIDDAVAQCPADETLMAFLAHCAPERIPMTLVEGAMEDESERMAALAALAVLSLIKHDPFEDGTPAVTMHRLVQAVAHARSEAKGTTQRAIDRLIVRLDAVYPADGFLNPGSWPRCAHLTPHLLASCEKETLDDAASTECANLLTRAGAYFHRRAVYSEARPLYERALAIAEKALGPEHSLTARSLNNLATLLLSQGDLAGARPLFERALAIDEKVLGREHPSMATRLNNLALLLKEQGDLAGARPLFERALAIAEKALGSEHRTTAGSLNNLASLLQAQGDLAGARPLFEHVLAIHERALGPEHPDTATSLSYLASLLQAQGDLAGARPLFERASAISEKALRPEHPDTARSVGNLARLLQAQGDLASARPLFERALAIHEQALGPEHPDTATSLHNLASLLQAQGDLAGARSLYKRALAMFEKALGPEHPATTSTRNNLANLGSRTG
jgi:tetratricopeptide (TPR) repeat protein